MPRMTPQYCPAVHNCTCSCDLKTCLYARPQALREELQRMTSADPSAKAIVFSQFTSMLDLMHYRLEQVGGFT